MEKLTEREREVLVNAANMPAKVVCSKLQISDSTYEKHMQSVRKKLCAKHTPHAVARALKYGIIKGCEIGLIALAVSGGFNIDYQPERARTANRSVSRSVQRQEIG